MIKWMPDTLIDLLTSSFQIIVIEMVSFRFIKKKGNTLTKYHLHIYLSRLLINMHTYKQIIKANNHYNGSLTSM